MSTSLRLSSHGLDNAGRRRKIICSALHALWMQAGFNIFTLRWVLFVFLRMWKRESGFHERAVFLSLSPTLLAHPSPETKHTVALWMFRPYRTQIYILLESLEKDWQIKEGTSGWKWLFRHFLSQSSCNQTDLQLPGTWWLSWLWLKGEINVLGWSPVMSCC